MFDAWTEQTTMVALGLVAAALVISISLAVQRWLYASTLKKAERAGDNEKLSELIAAWQPSGGLSGIFAAAFRPQPGTSDFNELSRLMFYAGRRGRDAMDKYLAKRVYVLLGGALFCALLVLVFGQAAAILVPLILGGSFLAPKMLLRAEAQGRQERIELALPTALDLLEACIEAGLGLEQALSRVAAELGGSAPDIADELSVLVGEIRAGLPTADAFRKLSERVEVDEVKTMCSMMIQSASLGAPLSKTLKQYSATSRKRRGLFLEERAGKVTAAMTLPLTICLLPSALLMVLGPAIVAVLESFGD
ncbi:MAG: type II secretion system F family protein [Myxococcota bacterium]|nr:type II secretion system F family protein [Myxococcota bacterium]